MDEDDTASQAEALAGLARKLLIVAVIAAVACLAILAVDYQLKKKIVTEADNWRREVRQHGSGNPRQWQQPAGSYQRDSQPGPVRGSDSPNGMAGHPAPAQDPDEPRAAPIVAPGNESARPPHRGAVNG